MQSILTHGDILADRPLTVALDQLKPVRYHWLWPRYLPRAHTTLLLGPPQTGKRTLIADLIARLTTAAPWPGAHTPASDQSSAAAPAQPIPPSAAPPPRRAPSVLLATPSTSPLIPRIAATPADPAGIVFLLAITESITNRSRIFDIGCHLDPLDRAVKHHAPALVVVELPDAQAHTGISTARRAAGLAYTLGKLKDVAARHNTAVLVPVTLPAPRLVNPLNSAAAFLGALPALRSAHLITREPGDPERRYLLPLRRPDPAPLPPPLAFTITGARLAWDLDAPPPGPDLSDLATPSPRASDLADAANWLKDALAPGPLPAITLMQRARRDGFAWKTILRAKRTVNARSRRANGAAADGHWEWLLPDHARTSDPAPQLAPTPA